jgi:hypothetical protein
MSRLSLACTAAIFAVVASAARPALAESPGGVRRVAIVIGANEAAPGRARLRYAHEDAQRVADTLVRVGRFAPGDVRTLLDPRPGDLLAAIDHAAASARGAESIVVVYYSGHSDGTAVFPHGERLPLSDLRDRISATGARVKVGILDTCRGGAWTRAKGLTVGPALDAVDLVNVSTEGTALVSSSSGVESAHEADAVKGSFFTHHLTAGLLGAADASGDGNVTLQEAFDYAKERTVRDSARLAATTQHPSFEVSLRGRQDVVLSQIRTSPSAMLVTQTAPLEVIHVATGVTVAETPPGSTTVRLALPPGRYVVRRVVGDRVLSKEVDVPAGSAATLSDAQLEAYGTRALALKGDPDSMPWSMRSTPAKRWTELRFAGGLSTGAGRTFSTTGLDGVTSREVTLERRVAASGSITYGITDRLAWSAPLPMFTYRAGTEGSFEVLPHAGLTELGYSSADGLVGAVGGGVSTRAWLTPALSITADATGQWNWGRNRSVLLARATGGVSWLIGDTVTLSAGAGWTGQRHLEGDAFADFAPPEFSRTTSQFFVGAVQTLGYRSLPLVQVHLSRRFSLDGYAAWWFDLAGGPVRDRYLAGFTWQL